MNNNEDKAVQDALAQARKDAEQRIEASTGVPVCEARRQAAAAFAACHPDEPADGVTTDPVALDIRFGRAAAEHFASRARRQLDEAQAKLDVAAAECAELGRRANDTDELKRGMAVLLKRTEKKPQRISYDLAAKVWREFDPAIIKTYKRLNGHTIRNWVEAGRMPKAPGFAITEQALASKETFVHWLLLNYGSSYHPPSGLMTRLKNLR